MSVAAVFYIAARQWLAREMSGPSRVIAFGAYSRSTEVAFNIVLPRREKS